MRKSYIVLLSEILGPWVGVVLIKEEITRFRDRDPNQIASLLNHVLHLLKDVVLNEI